MLLCFTPTDIDLPPASRPSAGQVDTQNQAWDILVGGAHGSNIDKRANAIQALAPRRQTRRQKVISGRRARG